MPDSIQEKLARLDAHFKATNDDFSKRERIFSRVIKLNEEVGELCEAFLVEEDKNQRQKEKNINVDAELADVLICTLLLALDRDVSVWESVETKLNHVLEQLKK